MPPSAFPRGRPSREAKNLSLSLKPPPRKVLRTDLATVAPAPPSRGGGLRENNCENTKYLQPRWSQEISPELPGTGRSCCRSSPPQLPGHRRTPRRKVPRSL